MKTVIVAAGVVFREGHVLLTQRKAGAHLAGLWEFPGGKVEPGEDPKATVVRELEEELGILVDVGDILDVAFHRYEDADKAVLLLFYEATLRAGSPEPRALDVAAFDWATRDKLSDERFPPADVGLLAKIRTRVRA